MRKEGGAGCAPGEPPMLKLILTTTVALYAAFIIWGKPDASAVPQAAPEVAALVDAPGANFDEPVILTRSGQDAPVTRAAITETVVPDAARLATAAPGPQGSSPRRIGDPVSVSLVRPEDAAESDATAATTPDSAPETVPADVEGMLRVSGTTVNMRSGPSTGAGVVASLPAGTLAEPVGAEVDGWIEIRDVASGLTGFMSARFLEPA